jgi:hypothetical protein
MAEKKCSCGIATALVFRDFTELKNELKKDEPDVQKITDIIKDNLLRFGMDNVEKDCGIELSEQKKQLDEALRKAIDKKLEDAKNLISTADFKTWNKLLRCAEKE